MFREAEISRASCLRGTAGEHSYIHAAAHTLWRNNAAEQFAQIAGPAPLVSLHIAPMKLPQLAHVEESLQAARAADKAVDNIKETAHGQSHDEGGDEEEAADDNETLRPGDGGSTSACA